MSAAGVGGRRPGTWVILPSIPDVTCDPAKFPPGKDLSIDWEDPPRGSRLTVPQRVVPDPFNYLYITAADPSGHLLLYTAQGFETEPLVVDDTPDLGLTSRGKSINAYVLCDTTSRTVSTLTDAGRPDIKLGMIGLIADPRGGGGGYMVAELMPVSGTDRATLLCYTAGASEWVEKALNYSQQHPPWESKSSSGVITHAGKLWWVDLSYGLLTCDPFAEQPDLRYVPLPNGSELAAAATMGEDLDKLCCVKVSDGKLRCVQIHGPSNGKMIGMWTLDNPSRAEWTPEYDVPWGDILTGMSYRANAMLSSRNPTLALVHPRNPNVLYFFHVDLLTNSCVFAVDVPATMLLECKEYEMTRPQTVWHYSSRFVHAWELPPPSLTGVNDASDGKDHCLSIVTGFLKLCQPAGDPAPPASSSGAGD